MRLDFNMLWVDDQPALVDGSAKALQRVMAEEGFDLKPTFCTRLDQVQSHLADDVFRDEIDLILVDWDLGADLKGQTVISQIRESVLYKDIIFYSANMAIDDLKRASFDEGHEGIYFVTRDDLISEVGHLFRSLIKKVLDLDHTRGIVLGATSDVDHLARECLQSAHDLLDDNGKQSVIDEMVDLLKKKVPDLEGRVSKLVQTPKVEIIIAQHLTFSANDGLRILTRLLDLPQFEKLKPHQDHVKKYINDVVPKRNILGHKVLSPEGKPTGIAGDAIGDVITVEGMKELRRLLLDLRGQFKLLHSALTTPASA